MRRRFRLGFTLVEIATVVAIIAVIAAISTTAILSGLSSAETSKCLSNLASIRKAIEMYASDCDGYFPPYALIAQNPAPERHVEFKQALKPYGASDALFFCPADKHARTDFRGEWHTFKYMSYTYALEVVFAAETTPDGAWLLQFSAIQRPAEVMLMLDQTILQKLDDGRRIRFSAHGEKLNVVYADGHAKTLPVPKP